MYVHVVAARAGSDIHYMVLASTVTKTNKQSEPNTKHGRYTPDKNINIFCSQAKHFGGIILGAQDQKQRFGR